MNYALRMWLIACLVFTLAAIGSAPDAANAGGGDVPWSCSVPMLVIPKIKATAVADVGEGVTYLYVGDKHPRWNHGRYDGEPDLRTDYGAEALFTTPLDGRRGWYDSGIRLGPLNENNGFVQIETSRWDRFAYKQHAAVAWAVPHASVVEYRDLGLALADDKPHRLGIFVWDGSVHLLVDRRIICSTRASYFVADSEPKYFQIRTETSAIGTNTGARLADIRLKRDGDAFSRPYTSDCVLHRFGIFWEPVGHHSYAARGAFYPSETVYFTGLDPSQPCHP